MPCLISINGTSGSVEVKYLNGGKAATIVALAGDSVYVPDAATQVTYTRLSGDASASSICVTVTEIPLKLYHFSWEVVDATLPFKFTSLLLNETSHPFVALKYNSKGKTVGKVINGAAIANVTAPFAKVELSGGLTIMHLILEVKGTEKPQLKLEATNAAQSLFIKGVEVASVDSSFESLELCDVITTTTTTTSTTSTTTAAPTTTTTTSSSTTTTTTSAAV